MSAQLHKHWGDMAFFEIYHRDEQITRTDFFQLSDFLIMFYMKHQKRARLHIEYNLTEISTNVKSI